MFEGYEDVLVDDCEATRQLKRENYTSGSLESTVIIEEKIILSYRAASEVVS